VVVPDRVVAGSCALVSNSARCAGVIARPCSHILPTVTARHRSTESNQIGYTSSVIAVARMCQHAVAETFAELPDSLTAHRLRMLACSHAWTSADGTDLVLVLSTVANAANSGTADGH